MVSLLALSAMPATAQLTAAVAANVQYAMEELKADFGKTGGAEVKTVYGSSGKLAAQIRNGAPFDVFLSADMDFPDSLAAWGYATARPVPYAYGKLVLWTTKESDPGRGLAVLADPAVAKIALAEPTRAPYGREALRALERAGLAGRLRAKIVYGESIAQVSQYVLLGTVDIGITAKSVVLAENMKDKGKWAEVDGSLYDPIAQGAVICKYGAAKHPDLSAQFMTYLGSPSARAILAKYGYGIPE